MMGYGCGEVAGLKRINETIAEVPENRDFLWARVSAVCYQRGHMAIIVLDALGSGVRG